MVCDTSMMEEMLVVTNEKITMVVNAMYPLRGSDRRARVENSTLPPSAAARPPRSLPGT